MDFSMVMEYVPELLSGVLVTLELVASALLIAFFLALAMTVACISNTPVIKPIIRGFIFVIRGTPLLVQIFIIYYGSSQFEWLRESVLWFIFKDPFACSIIALALNSAAYTTELFIGAFHAIPSGEIEAAKAYGMSWPLLLRRIVFPRGMRLVLPTYSNEVVLLIKASSLTSTITILDIMGVTQEIINQTYATIEFLTVAGIIYLIINSLLMLLLHRLERKLQTG